MYVYVLRMLEYICQFLHDSVRAAARARDVLVV